MNDRLADVLRVLLRRPPPPEEGDDLDGCALDFAAPYDGPPVRLAKKASEDPEREKERARRGP